MKKNKVLIVIFAFLSFNICCFAQLSYQTFSFDAQLNDNEIVNSELSACMDLNHNTHIAWIKTMGDNRFLMYTYFDANTQTFDTQEISAGVSTEIKESPYIVTDDNNNPHIAYILKRDPDIGSNSGNYAVMYARDGDGSGTFEVLQVSTNSTNPTNDDENIFNCYVNGRPNVAFSNSDILVTYSSEANSINNYDRYIIFATKNGSSWIRSQEINTDELNGTFDVQQEISLPVNMTSESHLGFIDISEYRPQFMYKTGAWNSVIIEGYAGTFANSHVQLETDNYGTTHYFWFNDDNEVFCHTTISSGNYTTIEETAANNNPGGNLFGATIDLTTVKPVYFHQKSFTDDCYLITFNGENQPVETLIPDVGDIFGKECINADNNYISVVTANDDENMIYLTVIVQATGVKNIDYNNIINITPNPAVDFININQLKEGSTVQVYNSMGEIILDSPCNSTNHRIDISSFKNGIYFITIVNKTSTQSLKFIKVGYR